MASCTVCCAYYGILCSFYFLDFYDAGSECFAAFNSVVHFTPLVVTDVGSEMYLWLNLPCKMLHFHVHIGGSTHDFLHNITLDIT